jgi:CubicO group peptidase (beta-lactamase class C family)
MSKTPHVPPRRGRRALVSIGAVVVTLFLAYGVAFVSTGYSQLARGLVWMGASVDDLNRFPSRVIEAGATSNLPSALDGVTVGAFGRLDPVLGGAGDDLETFLTKTESTSFLVLRDGVLVYEWYGDGINRETLQTSFSVAKSFLSTLIGIAIDDGSIGSIDDPITDYVPELLERDPRFGEITLRHLITMSSGLAYEEALTPWGDPASTYYSPNLRDVALSARIVEAPGRTYLYNNYNPLLLGLALERATGQSVTDYMSEVLWVPLGAEANASWSLDSVSSGFEKMESGVNARAIDFARFGLMAANGGVADGKQIVSQQWISDSTAVDTVTNPEPYYQYFWHVFPTEENLREIDPNRAPQGDPNLVAPIDPNLMPQIAPSQMAQQEPTDISAPRLADFSAEGNFGQVIYVARNESIIIVRLGRTYADVYWPGVLGSLAREIGPVNTVGVTF